MDHVRHIPCRRARADAKTSLSPPRAPCEISITPLCRCLSTTCPRTDGSRHAHARRTSPPLARRAPRSARRNTTRARSDPRHRVRRAARLARRARAQRRRRRLRRPHADHRSFRYPSLPYPSPCPRPFVAPSGGRATNPTIRRSSTVRLVAYRHPVIHNLASYPQSLWIRASLRATPDFSVFSLIAPRDATLRRASCQRG